MRETPYSAAAGGVCWRRSSSCSATLRLLGGHRRLLDFFAQRFDFVGVRVGFAQFALDGAHLFAQEKVALRFGDGRGDVVLDFGTERQDFVLAVEHGRQQCRPFFDGNGFEQLLPVFEAEVQIGGDEVGEMAGVFGVERGDFDLLGQRGRKFDDFLKLALRVAHHRRDFDGVFRLVAQQFEFRAQIRRRWLIFLDADAPEALDQHAHGVVGKFQHLGKRATQPTSCMSSGPGSATSGLALQHHAQQAVAGDDVVNELDARAGFDEQRRDHAGKNHDVRKAEDGQGFRQRTRGNARRRLRPFAGAEDADKFCVGRGHRRVICKFRCRRPEKDSEKD